MSIALRGTVLTANRRVDGAVVFLDAEGDWSEDVRAAALARASDERRALADRATYEASGDVVSAPRLLEVIEADGLLTPAGAPERSRRAGSARPAYSGAPLCAASRPRPVPAGFGAGATLRRAGAALPAKEVAET